MRIIAQHPAPAQYEPAREAANYVRLYRAKCHAVARALDQEYRRAYFEGLSLDPRCKTLELQKALRWFDGWGTYRVDRVCLRHSISPIRRLGELTWRQVTVIGAELGSRTSSTSVQEL